MLQDYEMLERDHAVNAVAQELLGLGLHHNHNHHNKGETSRTGVEAVSSA